MWKFRADPGTKSAENAGCAPVRTIRRLERYKVEMAMNSNEQRERGERLRRLGLEEGDYYYSPEGYLVFTEQYHLKRGYCCQSGCRHCPFGFHEKNPKSPSR